MNWAGAGIVLIVAEIKRPDAKGPIICHHHWLMDKADPIHGDCDTPCLSAGESGRSLLWNLRASLPSFLLMMDSSLPRSPFF